jgi:uncharacterized protein (TIGR01777 family)
MKILVTGSTGLIGSALLSFMTGRGHQVVGLVRPGSSPGSRLAEAIPWDPEAGILDATRLEGLDAIVHLAGENIGASRWTESRKIRLIDSRVKGSQLLAMALSRLQRSPRVFLAASAVGYYGNRGEEWLNENASPGQGFLADLCKRWETATSAAAEKGIRVVHLRMGIVLAGSGGALGRMLPPFRLGLGGPIGNGQQYMSWMALDDVLGAILHLLDHEELAGPVNVTSPNPVTNCEFTKTLGHLLSRPTVARLPAFAARLAFGQMADELLLSGARVRPQKLLDSGYQFLYPELEEALRHVLGNE